MSDRYVFWSPSCLDFAFIRMYSKCIVDTLLPTKSKYYPVLNSVTAVAESELSNFLNYFSILVPKPERWLLNRRGGSCFPLA